MADEADGENIAESVTPLKDLFHINHFSKFYRLFVPASVLIGLVCGLIMATFQVLIDLTIVAFGWMPIYIAPLFGGVFSGLLIYFGFREVEGSGISKAIELTHNPGELKTRTVFTKMLATSISIGSGNPVGREGPAVLIGAAIGNFVGRKLGYDDAPHLRVFLMMGSAACTAGIYKAPLGGALFATEAPYKRDARVGYYVPTVLSAIVSYLVFAALLGIHPILDLSVEFTFTFSVVPLVLLLGVCAGLIAILFSISLMFTRNIFKIHLPDWADPIAGSLFACAVLFVLTFFVNSELTIAGLGYEVISYLASSPVPVLVLILLLAGKLFASSFVVAGRVSGGVLASSIFVGAMLGALFGEVFAPEYRTAFLILGMGAVLAATTNTPIATTILVLEISHSFELLIPLAICICVSYLVGAGTSLYEGQKVTRSDEDPNFFAVIKSKEYQLEFKTDSHNPVNTKSDTKVDGEDSND